VVPACAALDCLTVFSRTVSDGAAIMAVMERGEAGAADVWRRTPPALPAVGQQFKFAVPNEQFLDWEGPGGRDITIHTSSKNNQQLFHLPMTPVACTRTAVSWTNVAVHLPSCYSVGHHQASGLEGIAAQHQGCGLPGQQPLDGGGLNCGWFRLVVRCPCEVVPCCWG